LPSTLGQIDLFYEQLIAKYVSETLTVDRPWLRQAVEAYLLDPEARYVLLVGEPGAGKTAFIAALANANPAWLRYFIRADSLTPVSGGSASAWLLRIGHQLAGRRPELFEQELLEIVVKQRIHEAAEDATVAGVRIENLRASPFRQGAIHVQQDIGRLSGDLVGLDVLHATLEPRLLEPETLGYLAVLDPALALARLKPHEQIVILIDALDELSESHSEATIIDWLEDGEELPSNVRIVMTSRPTERLRSFCGTRRKAVRQITLDARSPDVLADVRNFATGLFKTLDIPDAFQPFRIEAAVDALGRSANGNFAYLTAYARALRAALSARYDDTLGELLRFEALPRGLNFLYATFLRRIRRQVERMGRLEVAEPTGADDEFIAAWEGVGQRFIGVLSVARAALSLEQLRVLGGIRVWPSAAERVLSYFVPYLDETPAGFAFFHPSLREFLIAPATQVNSDVTVSAEEWHTRLVRSYYRRFSHNWADCDAYGVAFLLLHAIESGRSNETDQLIENFEFLTVAEPDSVMSALPYARSHRARDLALAYGHIVHLLRGRPIGERRSYLEMSLLQSGIRRRGEADIGIAGPSAPWRPVWADCEGTLRHYSIGGQPEAISAIASGYLGNRAYVVTGDMGGGATLSDLVTGSKIGSVPDRRPFRISALASYSRSGESVLIIGDTEGMIEAWDVVKMQRLWATNGYHWSVRGVTIASLHGKSIVVSCSKDAIYANDLQSGEKIAQLAGRPWANEAVTETHCLASYGDSHHTFLLSGHSGGVVRVWDLEVGEPINKVKIDDSDIEQIEVVEVNRRRYIVCAALGRTITVLDGDTLDSVWRIQDHMRPSYLPSIATGALAAERVLYLATDNSISAYSLTAGQKLAEVTLNSSLIYPIARVGGDDAAGFLLGCEGRNLHVINEREISRSEPQRGIGKKRVSAIASVNRGSNFIACGCDDGLIYLRDPESGQIIPDSEWHAPGAIRSIDSIEYEGQLILACRFDGGVWISHDGRSTILADTDRPDSVTSVTLCVADGQPVLAVGTDSGNIETYAVTSTLTRLGAITAAHTWRSPNRADLKIYPSSISALEIVPSKGGTALASAGWEDKTIKLWELTTLRSRATMPTTGYVMRLASGMIRSEPTLMSVSMDLRCQFWKPETGAFLRVHIDQRVPDARVPYESDSLWYVDMAFGRIAAADIVVVAARDGTATIVDAESLAVVSVVSIGYGVWGRSIALAPSGIIAIAGARGITAIEPRAERE
jgi:WD40 repeat protein